MADELLGTWVFKDVITPRPPETDSGQYMYGGFSFEANGKSYNLLGVANDTYVADENKYAIVVIFSYINLNTMKQEYFDYAAAELNNKMEWYSNFEKIHITDASLILDENQQPAREQFTTWLKANATKDEPNPDFTTSVYNSDGTVHRGSATTKKPATVLLSVTGDSKELSVRDVNGLVQAVQYSSTNPNHTFLGYSQTVNSKTAEILPSVAFNPTWTETTNKLYEVWSDVPPKDELLGTWLFDDVVTNPTDFFQVGFQSDSEIWNAIMPNEPDGMIYRHAATQEHAVVYTPSDGWFGYDVMKTIKITDVSGLSNRAEFEQWLKKNATKQGDLPVLKWRKFTKGGIPIKFANGKPVEKIAVYGVLYDKFVEAPKYVYTQNGTILNLNNAPYEQIGKEVIIK